MLWGRVPKTSYVVLSHLQLGIFDEADNFNVSRRASILIYECMNIIIGKCTLLENARKHQTFIHMKLFIMYYYM